VEGTLNPLISLPSMITKSVNVPPVSIPILMKTVAQTYSLCGS
jgi:hypothetical protein